jgi:hypothetical protein
MTGGGGSPPGMVANSGGVLCFRSLLQSCLCQFWAGPESSCWALQTKPAHEGERYFLFPPTPPHLRIIIIPILSSPCSSG